MQQCAEPCKRNMVKKVDNRFTVISPTHVSLQLIVCRKKLTFQLQPSQSKPSVKTNGQVNCLKSGKTNNTIHILLMNTAAFN